MQLTDGPSRKSVGKKGREMYYMRFLRRPEVVRSSKSTQLKLLLTITTDLGDSFYPGDEVLHATIRSNDIVLGEKTATWTAGSRILWLLLDHLPTKLLHGCFEVAVIAYTARDMLEPSHILDVSWSSHDDLYVERRLHLSQCTIGIKEELGESIARHIW